MLLAAAVPPHCETAAALLINWQSAVLLSLPDIPEACEMIKCIAASPEPVKGISHRLPDLGGQADPFPAFLVSGVLLSLGIHDVIDVPLR